MERTSTALNQNRSSAPTSGFQILDAARPEDEKIWLRLWEAWPAREVFCHPAYCRLFSRESESVLCAADGDEDGAVLYPFLLRPIAAEPWSEAGEIWNDVSTPYGYGGPFCWNRACLAGERFWSEFEKWAERRKVAASFARLSLFEGEQLPFQGRVRVAYSNVVRSLNLDPEELWRDYAHKVRKNVKRARRSGLSVEIDEKGRRLGEFIDIYRDTMERRGAPSRYMFVPEFFERMAQELTGQMILVHVLAGRRVVSTELALVSARRIYSFLGGTLADAFPMRPNDLLKHELIGWAKRDGKESFVLGGGFGGDDGIFRYKLSFAPGGRVDFRVGEKVHDPTQFRRLMARRRKWESKRGRRWSPSEDFFPPYRG